MTSEKFPEDTENVMYIRNNGTTTMGELLEKANEKWGYVSPHAYGIDFQNIQYRCFGYDQYDPGDYMPYFIITLET